MATHKSAAVAARQRVQDHLRAQMEALTSAVENGLKAVAETERIDAERAEFLAELDKQAQAADAQLQDAIAALRDLGKTKPEIASLLDIDPKRIKNRRVSGGNPTTAQAAAMPKTTDSQSSSSSS